MQQISRLGAWLGTSGAELPARPGQEEVQKRCWEGRRRRGQGNSVVMADRQTAAGSGSGMLACDRTVARGTQTFRCLSASVVAKYAYTQPHYADDDRTCCLAWGPWPQVTQSICLLFCVCVCHHLVLGPWAGGAKQEQEPPVRRLCVVAGRRRLTTASWAARLFHTSQANRATLNAEGQTRPATPPQHTQTTLASAPSLSLDCVGAYRCTGIELRGAGWTLAAPRC